MQPDLNAKVAIVTGASSGMGQATAAALARAGARVAIVGRDVARLDQTKAAVEEAGGEALTIVAELETTEDPVRVVRETAEAFGRIDSLVHSAGLFEPAPLADTTLESFDRQYAVNVRAPFLMTQAALPHMRPGSTVLFISSTTAHAGFAACGAYSATKGAVEAMTRSLAAELAPDIRVNVIAPGFVATPMVTQQYDANPEMESGLITKTPVGFVGAAEDIANAALFLSSDLSRYMTGSTVVVDGGWTAQG